MGKKTKKAKTVETPVAGPTSAPEAKRTTSSSFYQAIQVAPEAPKLVEEMSPPAQPAKSSKKGKLAASWAIQVAVVAIPAAISGFSSYMSAKSDAEAGYATMVTAVEELQEATKELVKQQAYMQGELDAIRGETSRLHGKVLRPPAPPPEMKKEVKLSNIPEDLSTVLKGRGQPMAQQTLQMAQPKPLLAPEEKAILDDAAKKRAIAVESLERRKRAKEEEKKAAAEKEEIAAPPQPPAPEPKDEVRLAEPP